MKHQMEMLDLHPLPPRELGMLELKILISGTLELELKPNVFFYGFFFFFNSFDNGKKKKEILQVWLLFPTHLHQSLEELLGNYLIYYSRITQDH